jgi:GT2 family glycosyltransferase
MNKGVRIAVGGILGFLNVDDYYEPGVLPEVIRTFERLPNPTLLVGNCNTWDDDGKLLSISKPAEIGLFNLLRGRYERAFPMNSSAYFYHRSLHERIGPYVVGEVFAMDIHFIFRAVQKANVVYVDKTFGNYRYLEGTRTFEDVKSGMNPVRVKKITDDYRRQLPAHLRAWLSLSEIWNRMLRGVR